MKTLTEFINERLIVNKDYKVSKEITVPRSLTEQDIKLAWDDIFDDIKQFKNGNVKLGKLKLISTKPSSYEMSSFTLYPDYNGDIVIRRKYRSGTSIWISEETIEEVTDKMKKLLYKEGWRLK